MILRPQTSAGKFFLAISFGLLSWMAWPARGFAPLLFIAWIPLLMLEDYFFHYRKKNASLFGWTYLAFFTWNLLTTWWVYNSSAFGVTAAVLCNSLFMALVFMLFHFTRMKTGDAIGFPSLIAYWISFEYLHMNWDLSWPWLSLGNGLAAQHTWIQWYEYTGILGGTLWILLLNIILFRVIFYSQNGDRNPRITAWITLLVLPVLISKIRYASYSEAKNPVPVVVVQPNIDPYNEKFSGMSEEEQLSKLLHLASQKLNDSTKYLIAPETALPGGIWEERLQEHRNMIRLRSFLKRYPQLTILIGAATYKQYEDSGNRSATARRFTNADGWYDSYNTALQLDNYSDSIQTYHKSRLVPGVEKMPYPAIFGFLEKFAIDLGGMNGSLGVEPEPKVFVSHDSLKTAPVICYESVYGEYLSGYIKRGASFISIITNDGWWGDTPGYRQHLLYGRLRAIELRRSIARSANTGISCFINQRGDIEQPTDYWKDAVISQTINLNSGLTFYARHGDYLSRMAMIISVAFIFLALLRRAKAQ